ncbi:hypothetical protein V6N11_071333 [Hibiscus sabdariffa]|uniref:RNase H type-1 domain-containing protein n=1 Tax=Hibiscus sabdariffa TaxID=183260 RepID=A0ABR2U051_9ROSI
MKCAAFWGLSLVLPGDPSSFLLAWHEAGYSRPKESLWHILPFAILWTIWLLRNDIIFANGRVDPPQLFFLVRSLAALWFKARRVDSVPSMDSIIADPSIADNSSLSNMQPLVVQSWQNPPVGFLKLNVDGAMLCNGSKGGIGGLIRDSCGVWLDKFSHPSNPGPPILPELLAIDHGLAFFFANEKFVKFRLILECDCAVAVEWILNSSLCPSVFEHLVRRFKDLIDAKSVFLRLIPRSINVKADCLAKEGIG